MFFLLSSSIDLLNVNPGLVIWTFATFSIVLLVLWKFAWSPISRALDERNDKVVQDIQKSEDLRKKAEQLVQNYEDKLKDAKKEAEEIIERAHQLAEQETAKILATAEKEAISHKESIMKEVDQERKKALEEFEEKVLDVSIAAVSALMKRKLSIEEHKSFLQDEINNYH